MRRRSARRTWGWISLLRRHTKHYLRQPYESEYSRQLCVCVCVYFCMCVCVYVCVCVSDATRGAILGRVAYARKDTVRVPLDQLIVFWFHLWVCRLCVCVCVCVWWINCQHTTKFKNYTDPQINKNNTHTHTHIHTHTRHKPWESECQSGNGVLSRIMSPPRVQDT